MKESPSSFPSPAAGMAVNGSLDVDEYPVSWFIGYIAADAAIFMALLVLLLFILALALSERVRTSAFNLYVLLILVPELVILLDLACLTTEKVLIGDGNQEPKSSLPFHWFHQWAEIFYYVGNFYLNAVVTHGIFQMVRSAHSCTRYSPPSIRRVLLQAGGVYFFSSLYSTWWVIDVPWAATHHEENGKTGGPGSEVFSSTVVNTIHGLVLAPPILFISYVAVATWWRKLLKPTGKTRELYLYFMKIMIMYVVFYIPGTILVYCKNTIFERSDMVGAAFWLGLFLDFLFPVQTVVIIYLALSKRDIRTAWENVFRRLCCRVMITERMSMIDYSTPNHSAASTILGRGRNSLLKGLGFRLSTSIGSSDTTGSTRRTSSTERPQAQSTLSVVEEQPEANTLAQSFRDDSCIEVTAEEGHSNADHDSQGAMLGTAEVMDEGQVALKANTLDQSFKDDSCVEAADEEGHRYADHDSQGAMLGTAELMDEEPGALEAAWEMNSPRASSDAGESVSSVCEWEDEGDAVTRQQSQPGQCHLSS